MFTPNEISDFFDGRSGELLELTYEGSSERVLIHRKAEHELIATIPLNRRGSTDSFNIRAALSAPTCGVRFTSSDSQYAVYITERFQIRSVIKIALNHLDWTDEERLRERIFTRCAKDTSTDSGIS